MHFIFSVLHKGHVLLSELNGKEWMIYLKRPKRNDLNIWSNRDTEDITWGLLDGDGSRVCVYVKEHKGLT